MSNADESAFPIPVSELPGAHFPQYGLTKRELMALTLASAWTQALARRRGEPGYDDHAAFGEANRLAIAQAEHLLSMLA